MNKPVKPSTLFPDAEHVAKSSTALVVVPGADVAGAEVDTGYRAGAGGEPEWDAADFWSKSSDVVLQDQPATAIYINPTGGLVIRQEASWDRDEDSFIHIAKVNHQEFLDRLCDVLGIMSAP